MILFAQRLQQAGLAFISANARHRVIAETIQAAEVVCATQADAYCVDSWAAKEGLVVFARVATTEELAEHARWSL